MTRRAFKSGSEAARRDAERCLAHLAQVRVTRCGGQVSIARLVREAVGALGQDPEESSRVLAEHGIRVLRQDGTFHLCLATASAQLATLFRHTSWGTHDGVSWAWPAVLRELPEASKGPGVRFAGRMSRSILIPLEAFDADFNPASQSWRPWRADPRLAAS